MLPCPVCVIAGVIGGWIGGYIGINPPENKRDKLCGLVLTSTLTGITIFALKIFFNISLCPKNPSVLLKKVVIVGIKGLLIGTAYSLAINWLIKKNYLPFLSKVDRRTQEQGLKILSQKKCTCGCTGKNGFKLNVI